VIVGARLCLRRTQDERICYESRQKHSNLHYHIMLNVHFPSFCGDIFLLLLRIFCHTKWPTNRDRLSVFRHFYFLSLLGFKLKRNLETVRSFYRNTDCCWENGVKVFNHRFYLSLRCVLFVYCLISYYAVADITWQVVKFK
jgi:hypothetical protein